MTHPDYSARLWLMAGVVGWFVLTYVLQLGKGHPVAVFVANCMYWLVMIDVIATMSSQVAVWRELLSWRVRCLLVLLPYALSGWRIYWLLGRRRKPQGAGSSGDRVK